ncbi:glycosyl transferase [Alicyclobacillus sp. TC]|uniref:peptidoglycan glycosyltransferase n=2 Tax=Alicyclobacillus tolerans TaxID=90970 RepID=A0ABT9LV86_9BACL|nr:MULTISPECIES: biosynthetic peptidoglycan transglycosylase [Alicyclobacillus]MDP9728106.1 membrane peptidoglycan carboxypeptidase [Alicyclobacillus tengchongensis]QRF23336.1 glycosyl transferase [Alicyclobacillus sp. TC]SHL03168.1 Transglycosylase [Alicyclobacillus montanus]
MTRRAQLGYGLVSLVCLLALSLGAMDFYYHKIFPIARAVQLAAERKMIRYHVHPLTYSEIPSFYRDAVIATEDRRFAWDPGIDPVGILRSFIVDVEKDGYVEGGSTITQQLIDNTILHHRKTIPYKIHQALDAIGLYDTMSKKEVFQLYANVIYFGHGAYGLYNASEVYFHLPPNRCNLGELAMLAGLPNAPSVYDPFKSMRLARLRESIVLENMVDDGLLSVKQSQTVYAQPIRLATLQ